MCTCRPRADNMYIGLGYLEGAYLVKHLFAIRGKYLGVAYFRWISLIIPPWFIKSFLKSALQVFTV